MNDQLLSHLETFDSDEEFSESPELVVEEHVGPVLHEMMNPFDMYLLRLKGLLRRFARPKSWREGGLKALWLLPIAVVLGDYVGYFLSLSLSIIGFLVSQLQPELSSPHHYHEEMTGHEHSMHLREISFPMNRQIQKIATNKKRVQDCRKEISRLLGLIGAPALDWSDPAAVALDDGDDNDKVPEISSDATIMVVKFLEAHVQLLLAVDEAYRWLQISSSLHLGLGPRSQCVERVERASIAREFRNGRRRQSIGGSLIENGIADTAKEPQRGLCKSVLSLSNVRYHLAKAMVDQSDSILQVWHDLQGEMGTAVEMSHTDPLLDVPMVVDLIWIRSTRHHLASLLSDSVNLYCTKNVLARLTASEGVRSSMENSTSSARNAREYLVCNLLLGKRRTTTPLSHPNDPLLQSLMQYREQLDALSGAIWSCQQYTTLDTTQQPSSENALAQWWIQIQQLSDTCRAMEGDIQDRYFESFTGDGDADLGESSTSSTSFEPLQGGTDTEEMKIFAREGWESPTEKKMDDRQPIKTQVFKGQGAKSESKSRDLQATKQRTDGASATVLPPRDTMSERQMIRELQNRIALMRPPEDQDSDNDDEPADSEQTRKASREARALTAPLFLGASGSLLSELKKSIPSSSESFGAGGEEHILGE